MIPFFCCFDNRAEPFEQGKGVAGGLSKRRKELSAILVCGTLLQFPFILPLKRHFWPKVFFSLGKRSKERAKKKTSRRKRRNKMAWFLQKEEEEGECACKNRTCFSGWRKKLGLPGATLSFTPLSHSVRSEIYFLPFIIIFILLKGGKKSHEIMMDLQIEGVFRDSIPNYKKIKYLSTAKGLVSEKTLGKSHWPSLLLPREKNILRGWSAAAVFI